MKTFLKTILILILIGVIGYGGYYLYTRYGTKTDRHAYTAIPDDAIFIVETENLSKAWTEISNSNMWKHLINNPLFSDINEDIKALDKWLNNNPALDFVLNNRRLLMSAHMTSGVDYDFVFVVDLQKQSALSSMKSALGLLDFTVEKRKYEGVEITQLTDNADTEFKIWLCSIDNLLVVSFSEILVEKAIAQREQKNWINNAKFQQVAGSIRNRRLFEFYFNYSLLEKYSKVYLTEDNTLINMFSNSLSYSAFDLNIEEERLYFEGFTNVDTVSSYLKALSYVNPGKTNAYKILSDQTALYFSICYDEFDDFFRKLQEQLAAEQGESFAEYNKKLQQVERFLKIDLKTDFFGWFGNEMTLAKLRPSEKSRVEDIILAVHAQDIDQAKKGMTHIIDQIKKRSPVRFETADHKNFPIYYLNTEKGLFMLLFGNLFEKLEKPYFTFIQDYVVFSNSHGALTKVIDDYVDGRTLSHKEKFVDFKDEFNIKSNITLFIQMPKMYTNLYHFANNEVKKDVKENKDLILSFARLGFQLETEKGLYKNTLIAEHDTNALMLDDLEKIEKEASTGLFVYEIDTIPDTVNPTEADLTNQGEYKAYYPDSSIRFEGFIKEGALNGLGRLYYQSGNLKATVNYKDGKLQGEAFFYYDNEEQTKKAEVSYNNGLIVDTYKEFYDNGARKAMLLFEEGELDGDAEFYHESGAIKIEGKYKDGLKKGRWKHYDQNGELISKERWRKGIKR